MKIIEFVSFMRKKSKINLNSTLVVDVWNKWKQKTLMRFKWKQVDKRESIWIDHWHLPDTHTHLYHQHSAQCVCIHLTRRIFCVASAALRIGHEFRSLVDNRSKLWLYLCLRSPKSYANSDRTHSNVERIHAVHCHGCLANQCQSLAVWHPLWYWSG